MVTTRPSPKRVLGRGLTKRCGRCGSGHLFTRWFTMKRRCPGCDYKFEREEGFILGAFVINFAVGEGLIAIVLGVFILTENSNPNPPVKAVVFFGLLAAVVAPLVFYPFSKTIWLAIDLMIHPAELDGEAEA